MDHGGHFWPQANIYICPTKIEVILDDVSVWYCDQYCVYNFATTSPLAQNYFFSVCTTQIQIKSNINYRLYITPILSNIMTKLCLMNLHSLGVTAPSALPLPFLRPFQVPTAVATLSLEAHDVLIQFYKKQFRHRIFVYRFGLNRPYNNYFKTLFLLIRLKTMH